MDDDPTFADLLRFALGGGAYEIVVAPDAIAASELVEKERFDLVVLDVMLPRVSGLELAQWMGSDVALSRIPVLLVSAALLNRGLVERCERQANVKALLEKKPCGLKALVGKIEALATAPS